MNIISIFHKRIFPRFGERLRFSVAMNFRQQGRPDKWQPSNRAKKTSGKTLIKTGVLMNSINYVINRDSIDIGTNVKYGEWLQDGVKKLVNVKEHKRNISQAFGKKLEKVKEITIGAHQRQMDTSPRPFLLAQESDKKYLSKLIPTELERALK